MKAKVPNSYQNARDCKSHSTAKSRDRETQEIHRAQRKFKVREEDLGRGEDGANDSGPSVIRRPFDPSRLCNRNETQPEPENCARCDVSRSRRSTLYALRSTLFALPSRVDKAPLDTAARQRTPSKRDDDVVVVVKERSQIHRRLGGASRRIHVAMHKADYLVQERGTRRDLF